MQQHRLCVANRDGIPRGNTTTIPLSEDNTALGEVVVTGFVNKAKSSFTGSETTVKKEQLLSVGTKNVLESLQSFVPGLVIPETTSPVRTPTRSRNSASAAAPRSTARPTCRSLVVDGSEVSADYVYDMDMNDIETVTVLKDASASALYGSKLRRVWW